MEESLPSWKATRMLRYGLNMAGEIIDLIEVYDLVKFTLNIYQEGWPFWVWECLKKKIQSIQ